MPQEPYILLVEDNPDDIYFLRRAISKANSDLELVVITTGDDALRFISGGGRRGEQSGEPLLVLLDLNLPRLNGLVLLQVLRLQGWLPSVPVVVVSTSLEELHELESMELGAADFVRKPLTTAKVAELIETYAPTQAAGQEREQVGTAVAGAGATAFADSMTPATAKDAASVPEDVPKLLKDAEY